MAGMCCVLAGLLAGAAPAWGVVTVQKPAGQQAISLTAGLDTDVVRVAVADDPGGLLFTRLVPGSPIGPQDGCQQVVPDVSVFCSLAGVNVMQLSGQIGDDEINLGGMTTPLPAVPIEGLGGKDLLTGGPGNDDILGGQGNDELEGGPGQDMLDGEDGGDIVRASDGEVDQITCDPSGTDDVTADPADVIVNEADCGTVSRVSPPGGGGPPAGGGGTVPITTPTGQPPAPFAPAALDVAAPQVGNVRMTNRVFRITRRKTPVTVTQRRRRARAGTAFRYSLSEASTVTILLQRLTPGRRVGRRCRPASRRLRKRRRCTRASRMATLTRRGAPGQNVTPFSGRVGRRAFRPGSYRALITAVDAAGNRSVARTVRFRVVRR